ncbi:protein-glutamine gamma-glutamyltransferase [Litchfieldia salsa]|uniref:Protein-glutamine gamma-glutamyltransferase n=1 Tax=Litchfieldia salsa TaxID=930152 RepID=A0A1H0WYJ2_9BACI|nr:protein-glutamine gamma-glutamyltransferase [Litchfieldia salsa]SDP95814.1 protein-glutamine gamma-glutamyltransferase [Litchfieldia salsa]
MIRIKGMTIHPTNENLPSLTKQETNIIKIMANQQSIHEYDSFEQLIFEIKLRLETVRAAEELNNSGVKFATFATSKCNESYWELINTGAFVITDHITPSEAILDIFKHGNKYAFECATAMVIVFYKAIHDSISQDSFNQLFSELVLYDWHYDKDLGLTTTRENEFIPGDCIYFKNPEFDPETPYWRGENAIVIDEDLYYGHGIGLKDANEIITHLNDHRKMNASESAYMLDQVSRPDYRSLSKYEAHTRRIHYQRPTSLSTAIIGSSLYII